MKAIAISLIATGITVLMLTMYVGLGALVLTCGLVMSIFTILGNSNDTE